MTGVIEYIGTIENRNNAKITCDSISVGHFKFRYQTVHMYFGIIPQLQFHERIGNVGLICLKCLW